MSSQSRLFTAAALIAATALAPGRATADDRHERWEREDCTEHVAWPDRDERAAWVQRDDVRWGGRAWERAGWRHDARLERVGRAHELRRELAGLERDRAAFHARFAWDARRLARYDARYLERRAGLERELQRLTRYARR